MVDVLAASDAVRLTEFSRAFKAAARAVVLYPDAHPAISTTLGRLAQITGAAQLSAPLRISVAPDTLLIAGSAPSRPDAAIGEVASLLHAHLVGELTVLPGVDEQTWRNFLTMIGRAPDLVRQEGGIARLWTATFARHIEVREIDYAEVLRERTAGVVATWQEVVSNCLTGARFELPEELLKTLLDDATASRMLAELVDGLDRSETGGPSLTTRTAALIRLLAGIMRAVASHAPDRVEPVMAELSVAIGRVSPEVMLSLIARGHEHGAEDNTMVGRVIGQMTDGTIAGFVARNAVASSAALERVAHAFQALVVDVDRRERLVAMAHHSVQAEGNEDEQRWQEIARALLTQYSDESYVSARYAEELTSARMHAIRIEQLHDDPPERIAAWLGTVSTGELRKLELTLMLDLLRIEQDPVRRDALMEPVISLLEDLFLVGDFEAADTLLAGLLGSSREDHDARPQALPSAIVERLVSGPAMRHIIGHLPSIDQAQVARVRAICLAIGPSLVQPLAEALAGEQRDRTRERLTEVLLGFGSAGRQQVEQLKSSANPAVRRTAIFLLREFGGSDALPELTELLDDAEPGVQREAVRAILKIGTDRGYGVLKEALVSGTTRSREAIVQALGSSRDDRTARLLVYILEHVDHAGDLGWVYARAIELLGQLRDPESVPALRAALGRGEWWAPRRTATLRAAAASALARIGTSEAVAALVDAVETGSRGVRRTARAQLEAISRTERRGARS